MRSARRRRRYGFTLVELLVVITIILVVSALALPTILPAIANRQVSEAARIFQAALVGARDAAIRANTMRGIRLLPDPILTQPPVGSVSSIIPTGGTTTLAYNRIQQLETAPDYTEGLVNIGPMWYSATASSNVGGSTKTFPPAYPVGGTTYPFPNTTGVPQVLMIEESVYQGGYQLGAAALFNSPTNWYWNIRVGDQLRMGSTGRFYTVVGPLTNSPWTTGDNLELFVNVGAPGTPPPLTRTYYTSTSTVTGTPEFLFLVNGKDDNANGYPDDGWDGFDNNYNTVVDEVGEWETEFWYGNQQSVRVIDDYSAMPTGSPTPQWLSLWGKGTTTPTVQDAAYVIRRRPVPVEGAREVMLPTGTVIDATTLVQLNTTSGFPQINFGSERSRIPVDPYSLNVDVMLLPNGQYVPTTIYSSPTAFNDPVYLFWITKREDVFAPNLITGVPYLLPMPKGSSNYPNTSDTTPRYLTADRWMVNLFTKSGNITSDVIENFDGTNPSLPFYDAMQGMTGAK